jgi:uroporphyrinogen decarboxylase
MRHFERVEAILNYKNYDMMPVVHFGFWRETLLKWADEGHITQAEANDWSDGTPTDFRLTAKLGFDFNWYNCFVPDTYLCPPFEVEILEELPDGTQKVLNGSGVIVLQKKDIVSIPAEIDHLLKSRKEWESHYLKRLQFNIDRVTSATVNIGAKTALFDKGGVELLKDISLREVPLGLHCGSLLGQIRNWVGVEGLSYLYVDDEKLFKEIIDTVGELSYKCVEAILASGARFDFGHFWEDICCKSGPLVAPRVFDEYVGPHYKRISDLLKKYQIEIVSVDCDGLIDSLIPTWLNNGVNTMFPIEVGTWDASIGPWRDKYGRQIRGVGGMNKLIFALDYQAIDAEVERLHSLVEMGGFIPCPDHRIAPDAKWDNVRYYCDKMKKTFDK